MVKPKQCETDTTLLIGIKSRPENGLRRNEIRRMWGNQLFYQEKIKLIFLLGCENVDQISEEVTTFQDVLIGNFMDSYSNLTFKDPY